MMTASSASCSWFGKVIAVVLLYWTASISMVFINKHLLSGAYVLGDMTIFVSWFQSIAGVGILYAARLLSRGTQFSNVIPQMELQRLLDPKILLLSYAFVSGLTMNNLMLKHISVAFYQVARSSTLIFTVVLSLVMLRTGLNRLCVYACLIVVVGFFVGVDQEHASGSLSVFGIVFGILASLAAAFSGIFMKEAISVVEGNTLKIAYFNNLNSSIFLLPLVISTGQLRSVVLSPYVTAVSFWGVLTLSGLLSLLIGWVSALQIKYTSPLTHHISINAKSVIQTVIAILYYQESRTLYWWLGNVLVIVGVTMYVMVKLQDSKKVVHISTNASISRTESAVYVLDGEDA